MHSSRMRTIHCSDRRGRDAVCPGLVSARGGGVGGGKNEPHECINHLFEKSCLCDFE